MGGVEANNTAIFGIALRKGSGSVVTSKIEHSSILNSVEALGKRGFDIHYLDVDGEGFINPKDVGAVIGDDTILVSIGHGNGEIGIGHGNGEIGTVQDVEEISRICSSNSVPLHLDARASFLWEKLNLSKVEAGLVSITGHTVHGPKGIGALIKRKKIKLEPLMYGPGTEFNPRPGTVNIPGAAGLARRSLPFLRA